MAGKGPSKKFYRRYAAFVILGIVPDQTSWPELREKISDKDKELLYRGTKRFSEMSSQDVMAYARQAVADGNRDFPKAGVDVPTKAETDASREGKGDRGNDNPAGDAKRKAHREAKPKRAATGDTAEMLKKLRATLNGAAA